MILWQSIYADLKSRIGKFAFNEPFYSLDEICSRYKVSQITARRVQAELERARLVKRIRRKGTVVQKIDASCAVTLVLPVQTTVDTFLAAPSGRSIYDRIMLDTRRRGIGVDVISESYLRATTKAGAKEGFITFFGLTEESKEFFRSSGSPVVYISYVHPIREHPCLLVDLKKAGYLATRHLTTLGHTRIGFMNGAAGNPWFTPRLKGYRRALKKAGIRFDRRLIRETSGRDESEDIAALQELMALPNPPTAIFAANDYRAIHVMDYCARRNIRIPADLSIVGLDNSSESSRIVPSLTTVDLRYDKIGEESIVLILQMLQGDRNACPNEVPVCPELIVRSTTAGRSQQHRRSHEDKCRKDGHQRTRHQ